MFDWMGYVLKDYSFFEFTPGTLVLDVGCGPGMQLQELERRGCLPMGIDVDLASLAHCRSQGLRALQGYAEQMPVKNASLDGLVCKGVIPFTDEPCAFREMGRVLKPGAIGYCCYLGAGYYLRYLLDRSFVEIPLLRAQDARQHMALRGDRATIARILRRHDLSISTAAGYILP